MQEEDQRAQGEVVYGRCESHFQTLVKELRKAIRELSDAAK